MNVIEFVLFAATFWQAAFRTREFEGTMLFSLRTVSFSVSFRLLTRGAHWETEKRGKRPKETGEKDPFPQGRVGVWATTHPPGRAGYTVAVAGLGFAPFAMWITAARC